eukprot:1047940-Pelagomonas_calceolata.AAC.1
MCYTEHTLIQYKQLGLDHQRAIKHANRLHAHSVKYAHKLVTTRRAIDNCNTSRSHVLGPGASNIQIPTSILIHLGGGGLAVLLSQYVSFSLIDVGRVSSAYVAGGCVRAC